MLKVGGRGETVWKGVDIVSMFRTADDRYRQECYSVSFLIIEGPSDMYRVAVRLLAFYTSLLLFDCLTSQQHAGLFQVRIYTAVDLRAATLR